MHPYHLLFAARQAAGPHEPTQLPLLCVFYGGYGIFYDGGSSPWEEFWGKMVSIDFFEGYGK